MRPPRRVLVIDDNEAHRQVVADVLADEGYQVCLAATGEDGLAAARAAPPDVLLLDLLMPGMDGAAVLEELRRDAELSGVPVVVTTGVHTSHVKRLLHPDAVLFKPFGISELLRAVEGAVKPAPA
jgi:CheY-like chemotaxis protein